MYQYNCTEDLYHWGVKGMKWGVRKKRETSGDDSSSTSEKAKVTAETALEELEKYKRDQKVKKAVKVGLGVLAVGASAAVVTKEAEFIGECLGVGGMLVKGAAELAFNLSPIGWVNNIGNSQLWTSFD